MPTAVRNCVILVDVLFGVLALISACTSVAGLSNDPYVARNTFWAQKTGSVGQIADAESYANLWGIFVFTSVLGHDNQPKKYPYNPINPITGGHVCDDKPDEPTCYCGAPMTTEMIEDSVIVAAVFTLAKLILTLFRRGSSDSLFLKVGVISCATIVWISSMVAIIMFAVNCLEEKQALEGYSIGVGFEWEALVCGFSFLAILTHLALPVDKEDPGGPKELSPGDENL